MRCAAIFVGTILSGALAVGCGPAHLGMTYGLSSGAAMLPATGTRGTTGTITYHEEGGPVARLTVAVLAVMGMQDPYKDVSTSTKVESERVGDTIYTTTTTTTTTTPTSPQEQARREANNAAIVAALPGILYDEPMPVSVDIAVSRESFGGDTHGTAVDYLYHVPFGGIADFAAGMGFRSYTFHDRTVSHLTNNGGSLVLGKSMDPVDYNFVGFPVRLTLLVAPRTSAFVQWDPNVLAVLDDPGDNHPSLYSAGLEARLRPLRVRGWVMTSRFDAASLTLGVEAGVGF